MHASLSKFLYLLRSLKNDNILIRILNMPIKKTNILKTNIIFN